MILQFITENSRMWKTQKHKHYEMKIDKNSYEKIATQIVMKHQEAPFGLPLPTGRTYGS